MKHVGNWLDLYTATEKEMRSKKLNKRIGKRLVTLRNDKNLTQEQFADRIGISRGFLSDLERGTKGLSIETLAHLSKSLRCDASYVLGF